MKKIINTCFFLFIQVGILLAQGPVSKASNDVVLTIQSEDGNNGLAVA